MYPVLPVLCLVAAMSSTHIQDSVIQIANFIG
jgi:hypothetical protein